MAASACLSSVWASVASNGHMLIPTLALMSISTEPSGSGCCSARRIRSAASCAALVAAVAPDEVAPAADAAQALGDGRQELVTCVVTEAVVDELEVVEVDVEDGER